MKQLLKKAYFTVRVLAYLCGLAGLIIMLGSSSSEVLGSVGPWAAHLLIAMFVLFLVSYVLYYAVRLTRSNDG